MSRLAVIILLALYASVCFARLSFRQLDEATDQGSANNSNAFPSDSATILNSVPPTTRPPYHSSETSIVTNMSNSDEEDETKPRREKIWQVVNRAAILLIGLFLGLVTFMPNVMMSDSGQRQATVAANFGIFASALFAIGGIVGCAMVTRVGWMGLLPAFFFQVLACALFSDRAMSNASTRRH